MKVAHIGKEAAVGSIPDERGEVPNQQWQHDHGQNRNVTERIDRVEIKSFFLCSRQAELVHIESPLADSKDGKEVATSKGSVHQKLFVCRQVDF